MNPLKKIIFGLSALVAFSLAPLANADTMDIGICNFEFVSAGTVTASTDGKILNEDINTAKETFEESYYTAYADSFVEDPNATDFGDEGPPQIPDEDLCGKPNSTVGDLIEKGDCTNKVITEISEVVTTATPSIGSTEEIVNLYQGVCCYISDGTTCYETRTYYTADYTTCTQKVTNSSQAICSQRQWLIASSGVGLLKLYVKQIYTFGATAVGFIAMAMMIYYGIRISAAGVSGDISEYKQKLMQTISGIVLLFLSAIILYAINPDFFG